MLTWSLIKKKECMWPRMRIRGCHSHTFNSFSTTWCI